MQREFEQAGQFYQKALQAQIEANDRYAQADTYHSLGRIAQEQLQRTQAEQYYQQALQIYIEFNDHYAQADTYHNLGVLAWEQELWQQSHELFFQTLQLYIRSKDYSKATRSLRHLHRLWQAMGMILYVPPLSTF